MAGESVQMITFVQGQPQRSGQSGQHLLRRLWAALLLEPGVVVGRHRCQRSDFLPPQAGRPPPPTAGQSDVLGLQGIAMPAEEICQG